MSRFTSSKIQGNSENLRHTLLSMYVLLFAWAAWKEIRNEDYEADQIILIHFLTTMLTCLSGST